MAGTAASMVNELPSNQHLDQFMGERPRYPTWMAKRILKHVLSGLAFLHQNGVVHGDVQPGNFLFSTRSIDSLDEGDLKQSESLIRGPLRRLDGKTDKWAPRYLMLPQSLHEYADIGPEMVVKLSNFGAAFWSTEPPTRTITPVALRAPELIFGEPFDSSIDIWSFGCLIYEFLTRQPIFGVWMMGLDEQEDADDDHLLELNDVLEPLPDPWLAKWPRAHLWIGPNRERLNGQAAEDGDDKEQTQHEVTNHGSDDPLEGKSGGDTNGNDCPIGDTNGRPGPSLGTGESNDAVKNGNSSAANSDIPSQNSADVVYANVPLEVLFSRNKPADMSTEEAQVVTSLIRHILRYDPAERPTAAQLLEHDWFKD